MKKVSAVMAILLFCLSAAFTQVSMSQEIHTQVMNSVFEILVDKHEDTQIVYEKKLPMERLPFTIRNDKYYPIGTAFLLSDGSFYSASHVISTEGDSVYDKYYIRDQNGEVYEIDSIVKFSTSRDYIKFTVPSYKIPEGAGLKTNYDFKLNTTVFSVGNALGEGIIIRNGTLTSTTFEDENGEWKWLRFSAAASPGNSGGPLINENGEVIGIITMKSQNENLNYALPVKEAIDAPENKGITHKRYYYYMPNLQVQRFYNEFDVTTELPKKLSEVNKEVTSLYKSHTVKTVDDIKAEFSANSPNGFLKHTGKAEIIYNIYGPAFPLTMYYKETDEWDYAQPKTKRIQLENNGFVEYGNMMGYDLCRVHKPDNISVEELIKNPKLTTEYCLKASAVTRQVANEKVKIKSLGEPFKSDTYKDIWGRTWFVNYFNINFADSTYVTYALPIPTGLYVMACYDSTESIFTSNYLDMQFVCDNVYLRYGARIKDWISFCNVSDELKALRSNQEKDFEVKIENDHLKGHFGRFYFDIPQSDMNYDEDSTINVVSGFNLIEDENKPVLEVKAVTIFTDSKKGNYKMFSTIMRNKPQDDALESTTKQYKHLAEGLSPYDGKPYNEENCTYLDKSILPPGITDPAKADYVIIKSIEIEDQNKFDEAKSFYEKMDKNVSVIADKN